MSSSSSTTLTGGGGGGSAGGGIGGGSASTESSEGNVPTVRREDQLEINEFGKLNGKKKELQADLLEVEKRLIGYEEAEEGVMLADESVPGAIKVQFGDCFVDSDGAAANEVVSAALASEREQKAKLEEALRALNAKQEALKKKLYARFGSSISLDDPTDGK